MYCLKVKWTENIKNIIEINWHEIFVITITVGSEMKLKLRNLKCQTEIKTVVNSTVNDFFVTILNLF